MKDKSNHSLYYLLLMSYRELENQNLNYTPCRVRISSKTLQRHYEEISYAGESKTNGYDRATSCDDEIFSLIRKHNSQPGTYGATRNVIVRIKVSTKLYKRLLKADLLVDINNTLLTMEEDRDIELNHGYWEL